MMKKFAALMLAALMAAGALTGCGSKAEETTAETTVEETTEAAKVLADKSLEDILAAIYEEKKPQFPTMEQQVDLEDENAVSYNAGLSKEDTAKVKEILVSEAAMGSQAYSLVLVRLNDEADASAIAEAMQNGINPAKWICVAADDIQVSAAEDVVMFVMISSVFAEDLTAAQLTDAFANAAGGSLSLGGEA